MNTIKITLDVHAEELIAQYGTVHITIGREGVGQMWVARAVNASGISTSGSHVLDTLHQRARWEEHCRQSGAEISFDEWLDAMISERVSMAAREALTAREADPASCASDEARPG